MVSIFAPHFFNWTQQLKDSGHEVYWLDVFDSNTKVEKIDFVNQIVGWRYKWDYPGRYFLKLKMPGVTRLINTWNERKLTDVLEEKIEEIQPDVIHSFVMYLATVPIFSVIKKYPNLKWIFSSWGSDLYYYSQKEPYRQEIKMALPYIDYMFCDCERDHHIAVGLGFKGNFLGVFPGGGGYQFKTTDSFFTPLETRNLILVKGYQGLHGKCIEVFKAMQTMRDDLRPFQIVVFGAGREVMEYVEHEKLTLWPNLEIHSTISHSEVIKYMGKSILYIGNSSSDGMPNTLLEALIMGAFPIQSNPGGASSEKIIDGKNGLLIHNPSDIEGISVILKKAISSDVNIYEGVKYNLEKLKPLLERKYIRKKVLEAYGKVEGDLSN